MSSEEFVEQEFGGLHFNDHRLSIRAKDVAMALNSKPSVSFPQMVEGKKAQLKGIYRFFQNNKVTDQSVLQTHYENTIFRCSECPHSILLVTDTTYIEPAKYSMFEDLKFLGNKNSVPSKIPVHYMIAVDSVTKDVLGMTDFIILVGNKVNGQEIKNEAELWEIVLRNTCQRILNIGKNSLNLDITKFIYIADRGADDFTLLNKIIESGMNFCIRGQYNRRIANDLEGKLEDLAGQEIPHGNPYQIEVQEKGKIRTALVQRYIYKDAEIIPRRDSDKNNGLIGLNLVVVSEINPPPEMKRVHWMLITGLSVNTIKESEEVVSHYCKRWIIEEMNKGAKTGLMVEERQFTSIDHLAPVIAMIFVISWRLISIKNISEEDKKLPLDDFYNDEEIEFLKRKLDDRELEHNLGNSIFFIAQLGGFLGTYKKPGWIILWKGWNTFMLMTLGHAYAQSFALKNLN